MPYLIFLFITQLISTFFMSMMFTEYYDKFSRAETVGAYFMQGLFYLFYANGVYKFTKSFYEIMQTAKIDDSDIVRVEIYITLVLGALFNLYGGVYFARTIKHHYGLAAIATGMLLWLQAYFTRKFYIASAQKID